MKGTGQTTGDGSAACCPSGTAGMGLVLRFGRPVDPALLDPARRPHWVIGVAESAIGDIPRISTEWTSADRIGEIRSRVSAYRMKYSVPPGIYAVGEPDADSDVLVSANYKLSFDKLRKSLAGMNVWVLVLDTKGINVWCAAGKGTFGTDELVDRIQRTRLDQVVRHRRLIVPQLCAPGVNARAVRERSGFRVYFGPVHASDIPEYMAAKYRATKQMRTVRFSMLDRMVLTPMEINPAMKQYYPWYALAVLLIFGLQPSGILFRDALEGGLPFLAMGVVAVMAGAFLTPVLLPFVPFRSFALKGWIVGFISVYLAVHYFRWVEINDVILLAMTYIFFPLMASYIALQFTGSTTYTGMSGVKKELRYGLPVYITGAAVSIILCIIYKLGEWGAV